MAKDEIVDVEAAEGPTSDPFVTAVAVFTTLALVAGLFTLAKSLAANYERGFMN